MANGLPVEFFARVIWQESRLRPDAVGPVTRSGHQAQGIAQFMPMTAAERLLQNPFDPSQALPKSAEFLRDLRAQFGNLGLAAAAYNAGPQRVRDWLAGKRTLPSETQAYVRKVLALYQEFLRAEGALATRPAGPEDAPRLREWYEASYPPTILRPARDAALWRFFRWMNAAEHPDLLLSDGTRDVGYLQAAPAGKLLESK